MNGPDWKNAPEGSTHYYCGSDSPWRNLSGKDWKWWSSGKWNSPHDNEHSYLCKNLDLSSAGLIERNGHYLIQRPEGADPK